uniref:Bet v I/Major latex protein domain-containing protein n=1 Tax=Manihot esculenta TaxID=3983 RepID=A0A2C9UFP0_MANES
MALKGNLETVVELNPEKFLSFWKGQAHQVPNHSPTNIQGVHVHEGDCVTSGSIKIWKYTVGKDTSPFFFLMRVMRVNLQDIAGIIEEIKSLAAGFVGCRFQFVKRNCNKLE